MKVKFLPQDIELEIDSSQSVMDLAHKNDLPIKSVCHGLPQCAECRVKIVEGEHNVLPPSSKELSLIGSGYFIDGRRLSCQLHCYGDVVIDLEEQVEKAKEQTHRRPQGAVRKEVAEESLAVTGNLIDQEADLIKEAGSEVNMDTVGDSSDNVFYRNMNKSKGRGPRQEGEGGSANHRRRSRHRGQRRVSEGGTPSSDKGRGGSSNEGQSRNKHNEEPNKAKAAQGHSSGKEKDTGSRGGEGGRSRPGHRHRNRNRRRNRQGSGGEGRGGNDT